MTDRFDLSKHIQFNTRVKSAYYSDQDNLWTVTTGDGVSTTCRYFLPASGPLSIPKKPPFPGYESFTGEWYQAANWPKLKNIDFKGKRIAVIGTGATGVQIIPKIAPVAKQLTVFQRTPNYVLPGRNYIIDEHEANEIKERHPSTWDRASNHPFGLAMTATGNTANDLSNKDKIKKSLDAGWECGGFHFQFETLDDLFTNKDSNEIASEYVREKIRAIVHDRETAEKLCPKYPFLSKRPPCGHFYYEAFNRPSVELVDIKKDNLSIYEKGIRTASGGEYEFDMIISALGFDAATGALNEMDIRGSQGKSLSSYSAKRLETFAGVLVSGFPNMFVVCGPHVPFGNMPVVLDMEVKWIGKTLQYMKKNNFAKIDVSEKAMDEWSAHLVDAFNATLFAKSAKETGAWFVGANIPGKPENVLFYFGGVPNWRDWLDRELNTGWSSMNFDPPLVARQEANGVQLKAVEKGAIEATHIENSSIMV